MSDPCEDCGPNSQKSELHKNERIYVTYRGGRRIERVRFFKRPDPSKTIIVADHETSSEDEEYVNKLIEKSKKEHQIRQRLFAKYYKLQPQVEGDFEVETKKVTH